MNGSFEIGNRGPRSHTLAIGVSGLVSNRKVYYSHITVFIWVGNSYACELPKRL